METMLCRPPKKRSCNVMNRTCTVVVIYGTLSWDGFLGVLDQAVGRDIIPDFVKIGLGGCDDISRCG